MSGVQPTNRFPCPVCQSPDAVVVETRGDSGQGSDKARRRRYRCANGHRFTTYERLAPMDSCASCEKALPHWSTISGLRWCPAAACQEHRRQWLRAQLGRTPTPTPTPTLDGAVPDAPPRRPGVAPALPAAGTDTRYSTSTQEGTR